MTLEVNKTSKQEEDKKQLADLGNAYRAGCYFEQIPDACDQLADFLVSVRQDYHKGLRHFQSTCDHYGYRLSCYKFGFFNALGIGCQKNRQLALDYLKKGCNLGEADSCRLAGQLLIEPDSDGATDSRDYPAAVGLLRQACELGAGRGCHLLSQLYESGVPGVVDPDKKEAFQLSMRGCDVGYGFSCFSLSNMYAGGEGVDKDEELAARYRAKAVDLDKEVKTFLRTSNKQQSMPS